MKPRAPLSPSQKTWALVTMVLLTSPLFAWLWYWGVHRNYFSRGLAPPHFVVAAVANLLIGVPLLALIAEKWIRKG